MTEALPRRGWPFALGLASLCVLSLLALLASPAAAVAPLILTLVVWALVRLPLRVPAVAFTLLVLVVDNPQERPAAGRWQPPLYDLGSLFFENLNKSTGLGALRVAPIDLLLVALVGVALLRGLRGQGSTPSPARAGSRPTPALTGALVLALAGLLVAEVWGLARGGAVASSLWQVRQLAAAPLLGLVFLAAFEDVADLRVLARIAVGAALFKLAQGLYFHEVICRPLNFKPPYVTSHSDTLLFTGVLVLVAVYWHERATRLSRRLLYLVAPLMALAIYLNGRRLAYVVLAAAAAMVFWLAPWTRLKRAGARLAVVGVPVAALYLAVGWNQTGGVFRPAQLVKSMASSEADRSTQTRDIENYNLVMTLKTNPLLGTGFGHEYQEVSRGDDISRLFPQYRLIPHNSLLGLWAFAGLLGFWLAWLPLVVGAYLAARSYPRARSPEDRATALVCLSMFTAYALQAYGDMGLQSWEAAVLLGAALAATGRLAVSVGAWPTQQRPYEDIEDT